MKIFSLMLSVFLLVACAAVPEEGFHPPRTEAERALERILELDAENFDLYNFLLRKKGNRSDSKKRFQALFTTELLQDWLEKNRLWSKEICGDKFDVYSGMCAFDYSPVTCEQNHLWKFFYKTLETGVSSTGPYMIIASAWADNPDMSGPLYRFVKQDGVWKMDGVKCSDDFRMEKIDDRIMETVIIRDFNYTKK